MALPEKMVGVKGFEPPTPCSQSTCATKLRYTPLGTIYPFFLERLSQARVVLYRSERGLSTGFLHFFARFSHLFSSSVQIIRNICVICSFHISIFPSVRFILLSFCTFSAGFLSASMLLYRLNPFSLPLNLHKARHFCPCKQFYAVFCS